MILPTGHTFKFFILHEESGKGIAVYEEKENGYSGQCFLFDSKNKLYQTEIFLTKDEISSEIDALDFTKNVLCAMVFAGYK